ncbi:MAG: hypothetical protein ACKVP1_19580, partial [Burkholderiaceae bacterium]
SNNRDTLSDFVPATDKLQFSKAIFSGLGKVAGPVPSGWFYAAAAAVKGHDADDRIIYNTATGALYYDADGSGSGAAVQVALLTGQPALLLSDLLIIN